MSNIPNSAAPVPEFRVDVEKNKILDAKQIKVDDLKQKILFLQKNEKLRKKIANSLNQTVIKKFTIKSYFCSLEKIYDNINKL